MTRTIEFWSICHQCSRFICGICSYIPINYNYNFVFYWDTFALFWNINTVFFSFSNESLMRRLMFVTSHDYFVFNHPLILCNNISSNWWTLIIKPLFVLFGRRYFVMYILIYCYFKCTFWVLSRVYISVK